MCRKQNVALLFQGKTGENVRRFDRSKVFRQHLSHRRTGHVGALLGQTALVQITARMLGIGKVHVRNDVHNTAVGLLGQAFILATVARFHVEDRNVKTLCGNGRQTRIGVTEDQKRVGLRCRHQLVRAVDDIAHGCAKVIAHRIHIHLGRCNGKVLEEHAVEIVVVILTRVGKNGVEIGTAFGHHSRKANDLGTGSHNDQKL